MEPSASMELIVRASVFALLAVAGIQVFVGPFTIGNPRGIYTARVWTGQFIRAVFIVIVCGRALGCW